MAADKQNCISISKSTVQQCVSKQMVNVVYIFCQTCKVEFSFQLLLQPLHCLHMMSSSWLCVLVCVCVGLKELCVNCYGDEM